MTTSNRYMRKTDQNKQSPNRNQQTNENNIQNEESVQLQDTIRSYLQSQSRKVSNKQDIQTHKQEDITRLLIINPCGFCLFNEEKINIMLK